MKAVTQNQQQTKSAVAHPKQPADNTKEQQVESSTTVPRFGFDMAQLPILPPNNRGQIQAKLRINAPNDRYEQEADRIADQVMRMKKVDGVQGENPAKQIQQKPLAQQISRLPLQAQRKCNNCGTCSKCQEEKERIQRKAIGQTPSIASAGLSSRIQSNRGSGHAMDASTNTFMSSRFGTDLSGVRIHTGTAAQQMSQEINARAFTVGQDVYFNKGEYQPNSARGQHLLAHELVHTVQQGGEVAIDAIQRKGESTDGEKETTENPRAILYKITEENKKREFNNTGFRFYRADGGKLSDGQVRNFIKQKKREGDQLFIDTFPHTIEGASTPPMYTIDNPTGRHQDYRFTDDENYGKVSFQNKNQIKNKSGNAGEVLSEEEKIIIEFFKNSPKSREKTYEDELRKANCDYRKVKGFSEFKPGGFRYNPAKIYNNGTLGQKYFCDNKGTSPFLNGVVLGDYYFDFSVQSGRVAYSQNQRHTQEGKDYFPSENLINQYNREKKGDEQVKKDFINALNYSIKLVNLIENKLKSKALPVTKKLQLVRVKISLENTINTALEEVNEILEEKESNKIFVKGKDSIELETVIETRKVQEANAAGAIVFLLEGLGALIIAALATTLIMKMLYLTNSLVIPKIEEVELSDAVRELILEFPTWMTKAWSAERAAVEAICLLLYEQCVERRTTITDCAGCRANCAAQEGVWDYDKCPIPGI